MEKLKGHGYPTPSTVGEVGQHYEDIDTGDIYECRIASKYSPTHGWPVGGYVWERRAKGEDIQEIYGSGGGGTDNRVHIGIGKNNDGEKCLFVYDNASSAWTYISAGDLCKKLKPLGLYPQITLTEIVNDSLDEDSRAITNGPLMPLETATVVFIDEYDGRTLINMRGFIMDSINYGEGVINRMWIEYCGSLTDSESDELNLTVEYLDAGEWIEYGSSSGEM